MTQPSSPRLASPGRRNALVAGAAGRLGEALLAEVIASPHYHSVTVLTRGPLASTVRGLQGRSLSQLQVEAGPSVSWDANPGIAAPTPELDIFVCWGDADDPFGRAHNRRDAVYAEITNPVELREFIAAAAGLQARRLLLLAPLVAWQQVSAASRMLPEAMEMELARLPIPVVIVMRPTVERQSKSPAGGTRLQRFGRFYLSQLRFMLPAVTHSLRSLDIARAALLMMTRTDAPGLTVVPLEQIRKLAGKGQP